MAAFILSASLFSSSVLQQESANPAPVAAHRADPVALLNHPVGENHGECFIAMRGGQSDGSTANIRNSDTIQAARIAAPTSRSLLE